MKPILKQLGSMVSCCTGYYLFAALTLYWFYPLYPFIDTVSGIEKISNGRGNRTSLITENKNIAVGIHKLGLSSKKKLILLGGSNVGEGFRPQDMQPSFPDYEIHNMAMSAANITQVIQVVNLVQLAIPESKAQDTVFVLGISYSGFRNTPILGNKRTPIQKALITEINQWWLYRENKARIESTIKSEFVPFILDLMRPFLTFFELSIKLNKAFDLSFERKKISLDIFPLVFSGQPTIKVISPRKTLSKKKEERSLEKWIEIMGTPDGYISDKQFEELLELCRIIGKKGGRLVIVDLPLPKWHSENSPHYLTYQKKKLPYIKKALNYKFVQYINLQKLDNEEGFYDSAHPYPEMAKVWTETLKQHIRL